LGYYILIVLCFFKYVLTANKNRKGIIFGKKHPKIFSWGDTSTSNSAEHRKSVSTDRAMNQTKKLQTGLTYVNSNENIESQTVSLFSPELELEQESPQAPHKSSEE
jgi:TnpA family transposase